MKFYLCKKIARLAVPLIATLFLGISSCKQKESSSQEAPKVIRLNLKSDPSSLDPRKGGDAISTHMHFLLFEGLVRLHQDGSITPAQARTFSISPDGLNYTFFMRGTLWSDGSPVTAFDFEKSWKDILDPSFPSVNAHLFYPIKNAEAAKKGLVPLSAVGIVSKDANTLIVTLEKPIPYFLDLISFSAFFPVHRESDTHFPDWAHRADEHFICNGPYILHEWKHNNEMTILSNPTFWNTGHVRASAMHFTIIDNLNTALQMFENKELDFIGDPISPLPVDALPALKKRGRVYKHPLPATTLLAFNTDAPPFNNKKLRKALTFAIDRSAIVTNITQMNELIAENAIPPILKNNRNRSFFKDADIEQAQALFEEALQECAITRDFFEKVTYYYPYSNLNQKIAQAIQQQWQKNLGIHISLQTLDSKILMDKLIKGDFQIGQAVWIAQYADPMNILERFKVKTNAKNYANWENSAFQELLEESFYQNGTARFETLEKAEEIFVDEMPICPLYHWEMTYMIQPYLQNANATLFGDLVFENQKLGGRKIAQ